VNNFWRFLKLTFYCLFTLYATFENDSHFVFIMAFSLMYITGIFLQWRRQDLLRGGAKLEIMSWGTQGGL